MRRVYHRAIITPIWLPRQEVKLLVDLQCLLDGQPGRFPRPEHDVRILERVWFEYNPQLWNRERAVGVQFIEKPLSGHQHGLEIEKLERRSLTLLCKVVMIS